MLFVKGIYFYANTLKNAQINLEFRQLEIQFSKTK